MMMLLVISCTPPAEMVEEYFAFSSAIVVFASPIPLLPKGGSLKFGSLKSFIQDVAMSDRTNMDKYFIAFIIALCY